MKGKIRHVVLLDDNKTTNFLNQYLMLKSKRFSRIDCFTEPQKVLYLLKQNPSFMPDLIFLDLDMPTMSGWEFLEKFEMLTPHKKSKTKIFILTSTCTEWKSNISSMNLQEYLIKPLNMDIIESLCFKHFDAQYYI